MDLLSPAESQAFKSFLSSIDYADALPAQEWGMYASGMGEDLLLDDIPQGKEALTKATKDLMSLDYTHHTHHGHHFQPQHQHHHHHPYSLTHQAYEEQRRQHNQQQQATYASTRHESFPFLQSKSTHNNHSHQHQIQQQFHHPSQHVTPRHTLNTSVPSSSSSSSGSSNYSSTTPTSPHPPYALPTSVQALHSQLLPAPPSSAPVQVQIRPASPRAQGKRPSDGSIKPPGSSNCGNDAKRRKSSPTAPLPPASAGSSAKLPCKPALLSPSQKKANHIQSEQKRRANIRRGYEALCETVPALREAIREEELAAGQEKKGKKRKKGKGDKSDEAENSKFNSLGIDGRAGPRSENVVLAKTIEYITTLLADRSALLARLHAARSALPPGHASLIPEQEPLWEREWKGGSGRIDGEEGDDEEEDEDGE